MPSEKSLDSFIRTEEPRYLLPSISNEVQKIEPARGREKDIQSVLPNLSVEEKEFSGVSAGYEKISNTKYNYKSLPRSPQCNAATIPKLTSVIPPSYNPPVTLSYPGVHEINVISSLVHVAPMNSPTTASGVREFPLNGQGERNPPIQHPKDIPISRTGAARAMQESCAVHPPQVTRGAHLPSRGTSDIYENDSDSGSSDRSFPSHSQLESLNMVRIIQTTPFSVDPFVTLPCPEPRQMNADDSLVQIAPENSPSTMPEVRERPSTGRWECDTPVQHPSDSSNVRPVHVAPMNVSQNLPKPRGFSHTGQLESGSPVQRPSAILNPRDRAAHIERAGRVTRALQVASAAKLPPRKERGRKTIKEHVCQKFQRFFRKRSPPPLPSPPPPAYMDRSKHVREDDGPPVIPKEREKKGMFARIKIAGRPILTYGILDSGNLNKCLLNEEIWRQLNLPLIPTRQKLVAANGTPMEVLGKAPPIQIQFENVDSAMEIADALIVKGLTVPLNISLSQIEKVRGVIDCSSPDFNIFYIRGKATPLFSVSTPYFSTSLDRRFHQIISAWKERDVIEIQPRDKSAQIFPPYPDKTSTVMSPSLSGKFHSLLCPTEISTAQLHGELDPNRKGRESCIPEDQVPNSRFAQLQYEVKPDHKEERGKRCIPESQVQGLVSGQLYRGRGREMKYTNGNPVQRSTPTLLRYEIKSSKRRREERECLQENPAQNPPETGNIAPVSGFHSIHPTTEERESWFSDHAHHENPPKPDLTQPVGKRARYPQEGKSKDPVSHSNLPPGNKCPATLKQNFWRPWCTNTTVEINVSHENQRDRLLEMTPDPDTAKSICHPVKSGGKQAFASYQSCRQASNRMKEDDIPAKPGNPFSENRHVHGETSIILGWDKRSVESSTGQVYMVVPDKVAPAEDETFPAEEKTHPVDNETPDSPNCQTSLFPPGTVALPTQPPQPPAVAGTSTTNHITLGDVAKSRIRAPTPSATARTEEGESNVITTTRDEVQIVITVLPTQGKPSGGKQIYGPETGKGPPPPHPGAPHCITVLPIQGKPSGENQAYGPETSKGPPPPHPGMPHPPQGPIPWKDRDARRRAKERLRDQLKRAMRETDSEENEDEINTQEEPAPEQDPPTCPQGRQIARDRSCPANPRQSTPPLDMGQQESQIMSLTPVSRRREERFAHDPDILPHPKRRRVERDTPSPADPRQSSPQPGPSQRRSPTRSPTPTSRRRQERSSSPADRPRASSEESRSTLHSSASTGWVLLESESEDDSPDQGPPPRHEEIGPDILSPSVDVDYLLPPPLDAWRAEAEVYADHNLPQPAVVTLDGVRRLNFGKSKDKRTREKHVDKNKIERRMRTCSSSLYDSLTTAMQAWRRTHRNWQAVKVAYLKLKKDKQHVYRSQVNAKLRLRLAEVETELEDMTAKYGAARDQLEQVQAVARRMLDETYNPESLAATKHPLRPIPEELIRPWPVTPREPRDQRTKSKYFAEVAELIMEKTAMMFSLAKSERNYSRENDPTFARICWNLYKHLCKVTGQNPPKNRDPFACYQERRSPSPPPTPRTPSPPTPGTPPREEESLTPAPAEGIPGPRESNVTQYGNITLERVAAEDDEDEEEAYYQEDEEDNSPSGQMLPRGTPPPPPLSPNASVRPSTAPSNVDPLPATSLPQPLSPMTDEAMPIVNTRPTPPSPVLTAAENPVLCEEDERGQPATLPSPPLSQENPLTPDVMTSPLPKGNPSPTSVEGHTPSPTFPIYRSSTLEQVVFPTATAAPRPEYGSGKLVGEKEVSPKGNSPPMSSTYLKPDEPELNSDKKGMLLEVPPPITGQMSTEIERIRRVGDFHKTDSSTPSPLLEGSQSRDVTTSIVVQKNRRRVPETAEGIDPPSAPAGSGKSGRIDKPSP